jgi:hypothetical protein
MMKNSQFKISLVSFSSILIGLILLFSCKNKQAPLTQNSTDVKVLEVPTKTVEPLQENASNQAIESREIIEKPKSEIEASSNNESITKLLVSFYSIGAGIDTKTAQAFDNFISAYKTSSSKLITYERIPWGREGELDYCISFVELGKSEVDQFIDEAKTRIKDCKMVHFKLNGECKRKR